VVKPKTIRTLGRYKTGADGFSGISVSLTAITTAKIGISETVEVNNPTANPTETVSESVIVTIT